MFVIRQLFNLNILPFLFSSFSSSLSCPLFFNSFHWQWMVCNSEHPTACQLLSVCLSFFSFLSSHLFFDFEVSLASKKQERREAFHWMVFQFVFLSYHMLLFILPTRRREKGIQGKAVTPFLLARISELTGGESLKLNQQLIEHNALVGALIAVEYSRLGKAAKPSSPLSAAAASAAPSNPSSSSLKQANSSQSQLLTGTGKWSHESTATEHHFNGGPSSSIPVGHLLEALKTFHKKRRGTDLDLIISPSTTQFEQFLSFFFSFSFSSPGGHRRLHLRHRYEGALWLCTGTCFLFWLPFTILWLCNRHLPYCLHFRTLFSPSLLIDFALPLAACCYAQSGSVTGRGLSTLTLHTYFLPHHRRTTLSLPVHL